MNPIKHFLKLSGISQRSWLNPLLMALLPAIIIIWLQPVRFDPFLFDLSELYPRTYRMTWYEDLENDGKKEKLMIGEDDVGILHLIYYNDKGERIDQHNFSYSLPKVRNIGKPFSADFNKDGVKEIIIFSQKKDSLFLNVFDYKKEVNLIDNRFITTIGGYNNRLDYRLNKIGFYDINKDSIPEFYFTVAGGLALYPRRVFRYDIAKDSLIASLNTGAGDLRGNIICNEDSISVMISSVAHGNTGESYSYPFHDTTSWLFSFDQDLNLRFPPKSFGENPSSIGTVYQHEDFFYFLFSSNNASNDKNKLLKSNWEGEIVDSISFDYFINPAILTTTINNKKYNYFKRIDEFEYISIDFSDFNVSVLEELSSENRIVVLSENDLNNDGKTDYIYYDAFKKELAICTQTFRFPYLIAKEPFYARFVTSNFFPGLGYGELVVTSNEESKIYHYSENPNRYFKYPLWFAIYILSVLFVGLIQYFQNRRMFMQQKLEQQLADLQLQNLRNQLDPHFTFNVLNSIGNSIYKQDKEAVYDLFQRFTRIIRSSLMGADKVFRSLKEELQFTQDYLEFQKIRFKDRFDYSISMDDNIENRHIKFPKMLIQGFAENAVKHAFYGLENTGQITIVVTIEDKLLKVIIEDNGIGFIQSKKLMATSGTQKGLNVLNEQVRQINKLYQMNCFILMEDKVEAGVNQTGTIVTISMPLQ